MGRLVFKVKSSSESYKALLRNRVNGPDFFKSGTGLMDDQPFSTFDKPGKSDCATDEKLGRSAYLAFPVVCLSNVRNVLDRQGWLVVWHDRILLLYQPEWRPIRLLSQITRDCKRVGASRFFIHESQTQQLRVGPSTSPLKTPSHPQIPTNR